MSLSQDGKETISNTARDSKKEMRKHKNFENKMEGKEQSTLKKSLKQSSSLPLPGPDSEKLQKITPKLIIKRFLSILCMLVTLGLIGLGIFS